MGTFTAAILRSLRLLVFVAAVIGLARPAYAQAVDGFNPSVDGYVYAVAIQKDGKVLIGGDFFHFGCSPNCGPGSIERYHIARLNADGTLDAAFNPGTNAPVYGILVQADGRIVIGGNFGTVGGGGSGTFDRQYLARLNPDGTVDLSFNPGVNMNNYVQAMALQPDGKILVGGFFFAGMGGEVRNFLGRLNADGTADAGFAPGLDGAVYAVALQADGKILAGGPFTRAGNDLEAEIDRNHLVRFNADGSLDMTFNPGAENTVNAIAVQADGKILVGGIFEGLGGGTGTTPRFNIGRLEANGIVDQDFIPGANDVVYSFAPQADGRIIVGGNFSRLGGGGTGLTMRNCVGRLNADGTIDPTFDPGANGAVYGLVLQGDGHLIVAGAFTHVGGATGTTARYYAARILNTDPAVQSVTVADGGATVTWLRNGTLPEVSFVDFAMSTDGVNYTPLGSASGAGTRLGGGWRVTGVTLPVNPNLTLRMRAHYGGAKFGASGSMIEWIVPAADFNTIENGDFSLGLSGWLFFATPDMTYIVNNVTAGVLNFYRVPPPPGTSNQAVAYQQTGVPLSANVPLTAEFDLGNSSAVRKRVTVLLHDSDFSDIAFCSFWLPANAPLTRYRMFAHTTKAILNLTISFYAASSGTNGGFYQIDNVSLHYQPGGSITETVCDDPQAPAPPGGADSATLLVNGDFASGDVSPGWGLFGFISGSVVNGAFEFTKVAGAPSGVILQPTSQNMAPNQILTATLQLGNLTAARQRVTVILHDNDFSDLSACTFWIPPGQPLSDYAIRTFATRAWVNTTVSIYPATINLTPSTRLDNVTFKRTPSAAIAGTECLEPGSSVNTPSAAGLRRQQSPRASVSPGASSLPLGMGAVIDGRPDEAWRMVTTDTGIRILELAKPIDLMFASWAQLLVESWVRALGPGAEIQVSVDGQTWITVLTVDATDDWESIAIDLRAFVGQTIRLRVVWP